MITATPAEIRRDDRGRVIAEDGLPISGLCSGQEAAAVLNLGLSTIYAMMNSGQLPSKRFGRARRIPWTAVRAMLASESGPEEPAV